MCMEKKKKEAERVKEREREERRERQRCGKADFWGHAEEPDVMDETREAHGIRRTPKIVYRS